MSHDLASFDFFKEQSMSYFFDLILEKSLTPDEVCEAMASATGLEPKHIRADVDLECSLGLSDDYWSQIYIWCHLTRVTGDFHWFFTSFVRKNEMTIDEKQIAQNLSNATNSRCLISDGNMFDGDENLYLMFSPYTIEKVVEVYDHDDIEGELTSFKLRKIGDI